MDRACCCKYHTYFHCRSASLYLHVLEPDPKSEQIPTSGYLAGTLLLWTSVGASLGPLITYIMKKNSKSYVKDKLFQI